MNEQLTDAQITEARIRTAKILYYAGLFDVILGIVLALAGPGWVPGVDYVWWYAGFVVAVLGLGLMFYARRLQRQSEDKNRVVTR